MFSGSFFAGLVGISMSLSLMIRLLFFLGFLITGPIMYLSGVTRIQWLYFFLAIPLCAWAVYERIESHEKLDFLRLPLFMWGLFVFLFFLLIGTGVDNPQFGEIVMSSRWYFFTWLLMFLFQPGVVDRQLMDKLWEFLLLVAVLQLPIVAIQYFVVSLSSNRASPWDAVVGTFPGNIHGGGESAAMGAFVIVMILMAFALWRAGKNTGLRTSIQIILGSLILAFAEVKAIVLLMPVILAFYWGREAFKRQIECLVSMIVALCLAALLLLSYEHLHYGNKNNLGSLPISNSASFSPKTHKTVLERIVGAINPGKKEGSSLGRVTHLVFWSHENILTGDVRHSLLGYGMGATQKSPLWQGQVANSYPYPMDISSSVILLWETGLVGHSFFVLILLAAARHSCRLSCNPYIPSRSRVFLRVGGVAILLLVITLPYKNFALRSVPIQLLMAILFGQILYWNKVLIRYYDNIKS